MNDKNPIQPYAETIVPVNSALPQEKYLSELALPFAVYTEAKLHEEKEKQ